MAELAYALVLEASEEIHGGSTPLIRTLALLVELAYTADLKSAAERIAGSNPAKSTIAFIAQLEEAFVSNTN